MRLIEYEWRLRELMAAAGMFSTTKLVPLLAERGVHLSTSHQLPQPPLVFDQSHRPSSSSSRGFGRIPSIAWAIIVFR